MEWDACEKFTEPLARSRAGTQKKGFGQRTPEKQQIRENVQPPESP
jgi:hypothetical protein